VYGFRDRVDEATNQAVNQTLDDGASAAPYATRGAEREEAVR
jgi:hypothetical protein